MTSRFANVIGSTIEIEELFSLYSDMYKDKYGSRPRNLFADQRYDAEWLKGGIAQLAAKPGRTCWDDDVTEFGNLLGVS